MHAISHGHGHIITVKGALRSGSYFVSTVSPYSKAQLYTVESEWCESRRVAKTIHYSKFLSFIEICTKYIYIHFVQNMYKYAHIYEICTQYPSANALRNYLQPCGHRSRLVRCTVWFTITSAAFKKRLVLECMVTARAFVSCFVVWQCSDTLNSVQ